METWMWVVSVVSSVAALITALTVIIKASKQMTANLELRVRDIAKQVIDEEQHRQNEIYQQVFEHFKDSIFTSLDQNFSAIRTETQELRKALEANTRKQEELNKTMQQGHIETWKNDIRNIYFNLRDTGTIEDHVKSYADKIYHVYKQLGGNSDIDAKYKEICEVYARRTHEKYEEAYGKNKDKSVRR